LMATPARPSSSCESPARFTPALILTNHLRKRRRTMPCSLSKKTVLLLAFLIWPVSSVLVGQESELQKHLASSSSRGGLDDEYWILQLINDVEVPALEAGQIDSVLVREGQIVRAEEVMATMENRLAQRGIEESKARVALATLKSEDPLGVEEAQAKVELYREELRVKEKLLEKGNTSVSEYRAAKAQYRVSQVGLERANMEQKYAGLEAAIEQVRLGAAEDAVERRVIRAPFDGLVMAVEREAKEWVNAGDKVVRIVRMDRLRVKGELSINQYTPSSVTGRPVMVTVKIPGLNSEQTFNGTIVFAKPDVTLRQDRFEVWAEIENRLDGENHWLLYPGLKCDMKILSR
jgi:multidrug efflux pump subunit AcrA (membrane-fusion protein)